MRAQFGLALMLSVFVVSQNVLTAEDNPSGNAGALKGQIETGGSYDAHSGNATRVVNDLHVPGALGEYGLDFTRYWNSTHNDYDNDDADWPLDFGMSGWSHSWKWTAVEGQEGGVPIPGTDHETPVRKTSITITFPDGHTSKYQVIRCEPASWNCSGHPGSSSPYGPPYSGAEITAAWPNGGLGVHDHITKMAPDGSDFWLARADGGSVHFTGGPGVYNATEVYDPHGFRTTLHYDANGHLDHVDQDGGRSLYLHWDFYPGGGWAISGVDTGNTAGTQHVTYAYTMASGFFVLATVTYENDPMPGQTATAFYTYGNCYGAGTEPCSILTGEGAPFPVLKRADDPHFAGPMTKISYDYRAMACPSPPPPPTGQPEFYHDFVPAQPYAIAAEKSDRGAVVVSGFTLNCLTGQRLESNGLGGQRKFYFGRGAGTTLNCRSYQLGKMTDFTQGYLPDPQGENCAPGVPCDRQNYNGDGQPAQIWDGRNNRTWQYSTTGDDSGQPGRIDYEGGGSCTYDRINVIGTATLDATCMNNDYNHWLFQKNEFGKATTYTRDSRRRVTQISYYNGPAQGNPAAVESFTYNLWNQVETHTLPSGAVQHYEYDAYHRLQKEYNSVDNPTGSGPDYTFYTYYGRTNNHPEWTDLVATVTDGRARANGTFTVTKTYNGRQQVISEEYPSTDGGVSHPTVRYEYDKYGNRTAVINEVGHRKDFIFDIYRRCLSATEQVGSSTECNGVQVRRTDWIYDRVIEGDTQPTRSAFAHTSKEWRIQIEPAFDATGRRRATSRTFDVNNRILSEQTGLIQLPTEALGILHPGDDTETHRITYDENGQKKTSTDPRGRVTTYGYDVRNRLETTTEPKREDQPDFPVTRFQYDVAGNKMRVTFPDLKTQHWENYDAFGQPGQFFDELEQRTDLTYQWGPMKKLDTVTTFRQPGGGDPQLTNFDYDGLGRLTKTTFPDTSTEVSTYEFGQLKTYKTRRGQTKIVDLYDARGRELHHSWFDIHNNPDPATSAIVQNWDNAGRMTNISNKFSLIEYTYDEAGGVRTERTTVAGSGGSNEVRYCRYPSGEVSRITYPNGTLVDRFYTARGQLQSVGWGVGATSYVYWPDGRVHYQARTNNVTTSYEYDGRGMISSVRHRKEVDVLNPTAYDLAFREYWRDNRDRIVAWKRGFDATHNPMENGRGNRYKYYDDGQLERAWYRAENPETENPGTPARGDHFYYDGMGNRVGWNEVASRGLMLFQGKNNGLNQYFSWENSHPPGEPGHWGTTTNYDDDVGGEWGAPGAANGVLMQDGYITAGYNALNQPIKMWGKSYFITDWMWFGYDPLGRLVKRWKSASGDPNTTSATFFYYDGSDLVQEGPAAPFVDRVYVHGGRIDEIVASQVNGVWYNHHYDAQGSCILLSNTSGGIEQQYDYDAFGFPYFYTASGGKVGSLKTRFLFTGREWINDMRIYDFRARMYQPELGRFLQPDPVEFAASDYNLYRYCHNDPVNKNDPTGLRSELIGELSRTFQWKISCFFDGGNVYQGSFGEFMNPGHNLASLDSHGTSRTISRSDLEREMSPSAPLSNEAKANLDRGCIGLTSEYQGLHQKFPEDAPGTKAYLSEDQARKRDVGAGKANFVFAKQAEWARGEPTPDKKTGEVPLKSVIGRGGHFNYVTSFASTHSYAWMNNGASPIRPQTATIAPAPPPSPYWHTVWYSTPRDY
ncbi:MAG TPA: RHS repeat-associated core domain-containing protein [Chthoniobacterales bacterium]|nr:RHS repeat-associated core domain-containing protein [Chthoniobacterales bacterium]